MSKISENKNDKKLDKVNGIAVTRKALADLFGLSTKRISQLTEEGVLERVGRGTYDLTKSVRAYITHLKTQTGASDDSKSLANEKIVEEVRIKRAKAEKEELQLKVYKGELHKASDVEQLVSSMILRAKSKLDSIPSKLAPQLVNIDEADYIFEKLDEEIKRAENELSECDFEQLTNERVTKDGTS